MRPALAAGAAFVCGEMSHRRGPCSSHTLRRDQRVIRMHLMIAGQRRARTPVQVQADALEGLARRLMMPR